MGNSFIPDHSASLPLRHPQRARTGSFAQFRQETLALARRLFIQLGRRPSAFVGSIIQSLLWLMLFSALFAQAPRGTFGIEGGYIQFLAAGIIVFAAFGGALNAGVPLIFDREFGFLNRLLVAPLVSRTSIIFASALFIVSTTLVQAAAIGAVSFLMGAQFAGGLEGALIVALVVTLLVFGIAALSLGLAFVLPGHIEMLAAIFVINLPVIFASTALAPMSFMPLWLQLVASANPLTYAIEPIRHLFLHSNWSFSDPVLQAPWGSLSLIGCVLVLFAFDVVAIALVGGMLKRKLG
ncbi:ABC transporter permease [Gloeobacter morelensis]|uniref:Transport permease protein n=1 Tax=Gloeobacter morelensis MG652769 TaxID=2781736 RepID=A0ABY3PSA0_9CYAN|nr:ABC transporter permease [Gloeobacter morelensis]UFP96598.1 ABC transporter permease [Gloeobacter morelensis MG652769]